MEWGWMVPCLLRSEMPTGASPIRPSESHKRGTAASLAHERYWGQQWRATITTPTRAIRLVEPNPRGSEIPLFLGAAMVAPGSPIRPSESHKRGTAASLAHERYWGAAMAGNNHHSDT